MAPRAQILKKGFRMVRQDKRGLIGVLRRWIGTPDSDIQYINPCRFEHINRYGKYNFDLENIPKKCELRKITIE